jgi:hypothetical protein
LTVGLLLGDQNDLTMNELQQLVLGDSRKAVVDYHRILKQACNNELYQMRSSRSQMNHIGLTIQAMARLTWTFF